MPSLITSIIGGIQGASAAHDAAAALQQGYTQAGQTVTGAVKEVNPQILAMAKAMGISVTQAAQLAGQGATGAAGTLASLLSPYISAGAGAAAQLPGAAQPFTASMMAQYSPAYQFQLQQGLQAANRAAAAQGVSGAGGTLKALDQYAQNYAGTAFGNAANIYNQNFNRLATLAGMGQQAAGTAGQAGLQAAEYGGTLGTQAAQWAGAQNIGAQNLTAQNTMQGAGYLANTQIDAQKALAQGDLGAAQSWNNMLGGIGQAANTVAMAGFGADGGWSPSNIGSNLGSMWGGGGGGGGVYAPTNVFQTPSQWQANNASGILPTGTVGQNPWSVNPFPGPP